jgi:SAM domain (Sterile alpha motif)
VSSALRHWLARLGLAQYRERFEADDIDLDLLPSLSELDLEKLGVSMGHRKRLLQADPHG